MQRSIPVNQQTLITDRMLCIGLNHLALLLILMMFLGFGAISLFSFASTGTVPESLDQVVHFMLAGLTLFAPYAVNKFSKMFENIWPKKS